MELSEREEELTPEEGAEIYLQMGDLEIARGDVPAACDHFDMALLGAPGHRGVLRALTAEYGRARTQERWTDAAGCLRRLIDESSPGLRLAKLHYAMAILQRDKLGNASAAVTAFEESLEHDVTQLKAFEAVDRILTEHKAWQRLEAAYRLMIQRMKSAGQGDGDLAVMLWRNLGEIYRTRMQRFDAAATAYTMATKLRPDDGELHAIVADLHERNDDVDNAIDRWHRVFERQSSDARPLHALLRLYQRAGRTDEAWCVAAALATMKEADTAAQMFHDQHRRGTPPTASSIIDHELWATAVVHPLDNLRIGNVFAKLTDLNPFAGDLSDWGLTRKDRLDLAEPTEFNRSFHYVARTLQLGDYVPEVFLKPTQHAGLSNGNTIPWSLIVGPDVLSGTSDLGQRFALGRQLSLMRLGHYLAGIGLPTANLKLMFFSAWKVTAPSVVVPELGDPAAMAEMVTYLGENIPGAYLVDLYETIQSLVISTDDINLSAWVRGVEHTSNRAGLLLSGDVETSARMVKAEPHPVSKADAKERLKELLRYAVSPDHFRARRELGIALS